MIMKRKSLLIALLVVGACAAAAGCAQSLPEENVGPTVTAPVEIELSLESDGAGVSLSWPTLDGVYYDVYRAPSRYASFKLIGSADGSFTDDQRYCYYRVSAKNSVGTALGVSEVVSEEAVLFGENVYVFAPTDNPAQVRSAINKLYSSMETQHFTDERYAVLFKPGEYDDGITVKVPYFTTFSGLGASPDDTVVGSLACEGDWNNTSLINFWRGCENLTFANDSKWAVSQGTFMRDVNVEGDLYLYDTSPTGDYYTSSGGFIANSRIDGTVYSGSQQQWFTRNSSIGGWNGGVWNMVFAGVNNVPQGDIYTSVDSVPVVREKPSLVYENGNYCIRVPSIRRNASAVERNGEDKIIPFEDIYFAHADSDNASSINAQIAAGKHIVFLPGVYSLECPINVNREDTVLLGLGLATLISQSGQSCMEMSGAAGASVCGLLFDAGTRSARTMLKAGEAGENYGQNPLFIFDCFFRVGGNTADNTYAEISLEINASGCVADNIWLWRADHGSGVGWDNNNGDFGAVINGDNVTCYGLFAEHYKKNNVLWNGDDGIVMFYQSEIAYDVPSNERWVSDSGGKGWASFEVLQNVSRFTAYGFGIYSNFWVDGIELDCAMRLPEKSGVSVTNVCTFAMSAKGIVHNVINSDGLFFDQSNIDAGTNYRRVKFYRGDPAR